MKGTKDFNPETEIIGVEKIIEIYDHWPSFHDFEITRIVLDRKGVGERTGPVITIFVHMWKILGRKDSGRFDFGKHNVVEIRFSKVIEHTLQDFNSQNVIDGIDFQPLIDIDHKRVVRVMIPSIHGVGLELTCREIEIVSIEPGVPRFSNYENANWV